MPPAGHGDAGFSMKFLLGRSDALSYDAGSVAGQGHDENDSTERAQAVMQSRSMRGARAALIALAIIVPALYIGFALTSAVQDYELTLDQAELDSRNVSAALIEHANRAIGEADRYLIAAMGEVERSGLGAAAGNADALQIILRKYSNKLPQMTAITLVDANGLIVSSGLDGAPVHVSVTDRDYFRFHSQPGHNSLYISQPLASRISSNWVFTISRAIPNADGTPRMLLVAGMQTSYFGTFYASLNAGKGNHLLLARSDGTVLAESPEPAKRTVHNIGGSPLFDRYRYDRIGSFEADSGTVDGMPRVIGFAGSNGYPLLAISSKTRNEVLEHWRKGVKQTAILGVFFISMFLSLIAVLWGRLNDLLSRHANLEEKNASLALAAQVFETSWQAIIILSADGTVLRVNRAFTNIFGYTPAELVGRNIDLYESSFVDSGMYETMLNAMRSEGSWQGEARTLTKSGEVLTVRQSVSAIRDANGGVRSVVAILQDVTEQKVSEQRLHQLAHFDALTNLPNRRTFADRIQHEINRAIRRDTILAVIFIDIDHFKTINDSLGHAVGDTVLQQVAVRLRDCVRVGDTVARIGGDEFVVLLEGNHKFESVERVATKLTGSLAEPIDAGGREVYVAASMGISLFPQDGKDSETLLRNADTAMYRAKTAGRNCWRFFDESMALNATRRLELEMALRRAVERNELALHYQPQRSLHNGRITGVEALLRWGKGQESVSPLEFIPLAEESGLIIQIGDWVLQAACAQAAEWVNREGLQLRVAVNVAAKQIHHKSFVELVRSTLEQSGLPPQYLELEITESSIIENLEDTVAKLSQLKALGVGLAIDDFGTGYSSLSYLKQLPVDRLKIDRSFVKDTPDDIDDCAIVRTIISMSHNLGLSVIAEGVETERQRDFLRAQQCDEIQGYLLSVPRPAEQITEMLVANLQQQSLRA